MLKSFVYIQNYKRIILILIVILLYISMLLIQNAYGTLCLIKTVEKSTGNSRDISAASHQKANDSNLFDLHLHKTADKRHNVDRADYTPKEYPIHGAPVDWSNAIELEDILISVKTTKKFHNTRLKTIIETWFQLARDQMWFFTDYSDEHYQDLTNGHMLQTNCSRGHFRRDLCCKMNKEFDFFLSTSRRFWCHFDDDNYVNIPSLVKTLKEYHAYHEWYLGKPSISSPIEMNLNPTKLAPPKYENSKNSQQSSSEYKKVKFWFATGGAGFCISRALAIKMMPLASNGKLVTICDKIRFPDDVTLGFIVEYLLKVPLTVVDTFHSHLERMDQLDSESFREQISFSYSHINNDRNVVKIDGFSTVQDPNRLFTLHCYLFPLYDFCKRSSLQT